jgi:hypothetical protein
MSGSILLMKVILGSLALISMIMIVMAINIVQIRIVKECKIQIQELFAAKAIQIALVMIPQHILNMFVNVQIQVNVV